MLTLTVNLGGKQTADLEVALEEVLRLVAQGYTSGANSNDTGDYSFNVSGEAEESDEDEEE